MLHLSDEGEPVYPILWVQIRCSHHVRSIVNGTLPTWAQL